MGWMLAGTVAATPVQTPSSPTPWLTQLHRITAYTTWVGSAVNLGLGVFVWRRYQSGDLPPRWVVDVHRYTGYTVAVSASLAALSGWHEVARQVRRGEASSRTWIHATVGTLAAAGYITAVWAAMNREFTLHRRVALVTVTAAAVAVGVWIW